MNKIAQYLNEHLLGEVTSNEPIRQRFAHDGSVLSITPELVVHPRVTNDIRKIARFSWQLAEKGHILPITARGNGSDQTGAAIGKGIVINTIAHLNKTIFISLNKKDQFVHVQPGANLGALNDMLQSHSMTIPASPKSAAYNTVGGAVANNTNNIGDYVNRLEVVLANGDLIETTRLNKHELSKKKGLQTFEGELYRKIDGLIDDNQQLIDDKISNETTDNAGYPGIFKVKQRDGSFDLTPLLIGGQGTLGVISEIVLRTDFYNSDESIIVAAFSSAEIARDAANILAPMQPAQLDLIDGELFTAAMKYGKKYIFSDKYSNNELEAVLFIKFNDFNERNRSHKIKNAIKKLSKINTILFTSDDYSADELNAISEVNSVLLQSIEKVESLTPIIGGVSVPIDRREEFITAVKTLAEKHHISLPLQIQWLSGIIYTQPKLDLHIVTDKQKMFKLIADYIELVVQHSGSIAADSGEGRLRTAAAYAQMDDAVLDIYAQIREAFDPFGTMNPGVKQKNDIKTLVSELDPNYSIAELAKYSPSN